MTYTIPITTKLINEKYTRDIKHDGLDVIVLNKDYFLLMPGSFIKDNVKVSIYKNAYMIRIPSLGYYHAILSPSLTSWSVAKTADLKIVSTLTDNNYFILTTFHKTLTNLEILNI